MEALTIEPKNKEQLKFVKAFLKANGIPIRSKEIRNAKFVEKINHSETQFANGQYTEVKVEELDNFLELKN